MITATTAAPQLANYFFAAAFVLLVAHIGYIEIKKYRTKKAQWKRMLDDN